jgi:hypothetical protein
MTPADLMRHLQDPSRFVCTNKRLLGRLSLQA